MLVPETQSSGTVVYLARLLRQRGRGREGVAPLSETQSSGTECSVPRKASQAVRPGQGGRDPKGC